MIDLLPPLELPNLQIDSQEHDDWQIIPACDLSLGRLVREGIVDSIDINEDAVIGCLVDLSDNSVKPTQVFITATSRESIGRTFHDGTVASFGTASLDEQGCGHVQVSVSDIEFDIESRDELKDGLVSDGMNEDEALEFANHSKKARLNQKTQRIIAHELKHIVDKSSKNYYFEASADAKNTVNRIYNRACIRYIGLRCMAPLWAGAITDAVVSDPKMTMFIVAPAFGIAISQLALFKKNGPIKINSDDLVGWDLEVRARTTEAQSDKYARMIVVD